MSSYDGRKVQHSTHNHFVPPPSLLDRILAAVPSGLAALLQWICGRQSRGHNNFNYASMQVLAFPRTWHQWQEQAKRLRGSFNLPNVFILIWTFLLLWGERWVFDSSVKACDWRTWERWAPGAAPHHLILLADPQLVDPHTYPGRPWPLSTFTELHTDNYLKRSFIQIQKSLHPDTVLFLGDLFDGGREWGTRDGTTDDPAWADPPRSASEFEYFKDWKKDYKDSFWLSEYSRFGEIFFKHWNDGGLLAGAGQRGRKIITGLPGNHDIGFGTNSRYHARQRFQAYFGETNRVDVIGNHSIVSVDGLSLSARGAGILDVANISSPVEAFLEDVKPMKRRAVARELRYMRGEAEGLKRRHSVSDLAVADYTQVSTLDPGLGSPGFPTILLTHVPLYRDVGTPCGPQREHWPPTQPPAGQITPINPDDRNAISISKGYQYQNVLSSDDSIHIIESVGDVVSVFSGDDHDYCEITHPQNRGGMKEITVKSISWAMGVRRPGFLMVSLWNPVDTTGESLGTHSGGHGATNPSGQSMTIETHLCLLPDQISIFLRYLLVLSLSLLVLILRAILVPLLKLSPFAAVDAPKQTSDNDSPLLPTSISTKNRTTSPRQDDDHYHHHSHGSNCSTSSTGSKTLLAPRSSAARTRSVSPAPSYGYGLPAAPTATLQSTSYPAPSRDVTPILTNIAGHYPPIAFAKRDDDYYDAGDEEAEWGRERSGSSSGGGGGSRPVRRGPHRPLTKAEIALREAWTSIYRVAWVVGLVYLYLVWRG